jgi:lysine 6-dehydrogenase
MSFRYAVLGAGRQGVALAYDLVRNGEAAHVTLADADGDTARRAVERVRSLLPESSCELAPRRCDAGHPGEVRELVRGARVVVSAVPYRFNLALTQAVIEARASFCDLGGNTSIVRSQLALHEAARAAGVSVVPDCGLAPGLSNHLAAHGIESLEHPEHVHVRCGGLPEHPVGPLGYKLLFNFEGLINEYSGFGEYLRGGARVEVPALTEIEEHDFGPGVGRLEAAVTSGGTSTCPQTWLGRLQSYDYKTLRYPGHWTIVRALFELGCFEPSLPDPRGGVLEPRRTLRALLEERLAFPEVRDIALLRVTVRGTDRGSPRTLRYDLFERHDERTGFTAMERATAFPAALVAHLQARGRVAPGARPLETSVPAREFFDELPQHDIRVTLASS